VWAVWDVEYNLVADTDYSTRVLQNSVPVSVTLKKDDYSFYSYHQMVVCDLQVVLTPISGQPTMYVKKGTRPTVIDSDWGPVYGAGQIIIRKADPEFYYIGVFSGNVDSSFSVSVVSQTVGNRSENEEGVSLVDGVSSYGSVLKDAFAYYTFTVGPSDTSETKNALISLTVLRGKPEMYIKNTSQPSLESYDYSITDTKRPLQIRDAVPVNSREIWNIGVYGNNSEADFYITATIQNSVQVLQQGVPTTGELIAGEFAYYVIESKAATKDIYIHVTSIVGIPTIYVSRTMTRPNATNHDYVSYQDALGVSVLIPFEDITAHKSLHMTIKAGISKTRFEVIVYYQEIVSLIEGSSQQAELDSATNDIFM